MLKPFNEKGKIRKNQNYENSNKPATIPTNHRKSANDFKDLNKFEKRWAVGLCLASSASLIPFALYPASISLPKNKQLYDLFNGTI